MTAVGQESPQLHSEPQVQLLSNGRYHVMVTSAGGSSSRWNDMAVTRWEDWYAEVDRSFGRLKERCDDVVVMGLSMGGTLALRVAEQAFVELTGGGAKALIGRTERQIAAELEYRMRMLGADKPSFESIIAAGPNGSKPHYRPRDRVVRKGEAVLIDWGAMVDGYCSDLTRVVFTGTIPPKIAELYEIVLRAQQAGIAALSAGAACKKVDAAARQVVEDGGYGKQFVHGLGHGLGRQVHEAPSLARTSDTRLRCGMVVTVEPGIYLPGVGGVRIEDDVLVARQGPRRLSRLSRDLQAMVLR